MLLWPHSSGYIIFLPPLPGNLRPRHYWLRTAGCWSIRSCNRSPPGLGLLWGLCSAADSSQQEYARAANAFILPAPLCLADNRSGRPWGDSGLTLVGDRAGGVAPRFWMLLTAEKGVLSPRKAGMPSRQGFHCGLSRGCECSLLIMRLWKAG